MKKTAIMLLVSTLFIASCNNESEIKSDNKKETTASTAAQSAQQTTSTANKDTMLGAKIYQTACMSCHAPTAAKGKAKVAPPIFAVKDHVIRVYPKREDFIKRVVNWVKTPDANDILMPGAVRKFGLMPAMPHLDKKDVTAVAEYLYDTDLGTPDWYKEHYEAEHGKQKN